MNCVLLLSLLTPLVFCSDYPPPRELFTLSWTGGPFAWPSALVRSMYKSTGKFIPANMVTTRVVIFRDDVYAVFPRYLPGVAATLAKTSLLSLNHEPVFEPYPSWEAQAEGDCSALQNAVDIFLDSNNMLWVLDTGVTQTLDTPVRKCAPKAVAFDLITGKQVYKVDLSAVTTETSRLQYIVADLDILARRFLYISDAAQRAIIVHNLSEDTSYRVVLPESVTGGCASPDVLYLAMAKPQEGGRRLYVTCLCGGEVYSLKTEDLQAGTDHGALELAGHKEGRMVIIGTDCKNTIYFRYEGKSGVYSWDVNQELSADNVHLVHTGDSLLLATQAVLDPLRGKVRLLQSNILDYLRRSVGVGAVHVLSALS